MKKTLLSAVLIGLSVLLSSAAPPKSSGRKFVDKVLPLTVGVTASGTIATPAEQDRFTFTGAVGQRIVFDGQGNNAINLTVQLVAPSGEVLLFVAHGSDGGPIYLKEAGTYTVMIDGTGDVTGAYSFRILDKNAAPGLTLGATTSGQLNPATEMDLFKFTGTAGQRVNLESISSSSTDANWFLVAPNNTSLAGNNVSGNLGEVFLPVSGAYGIMAQGATFGGAALDYQIKVSVVSDPIGSTSGFGTPHSGTINPGETQDFTYTAPAGTVVYFDSLDNTGFSLAADLKAPDSTIVLTASAYADAGPLTLPQSGTYTLTMRGTDTSGSGTFNFRLLNLADGTALTFSAPVPETAVPVLQTDVYRFTGAPGQRLYYDALENGFESVTARLITPSFSQYFGGNSESDGGPLMLPEPGTHWLLLENTQPAAADYTFRLIDAAQNPASAIAFDDTTTGNLSSPGFKTKIYRFDGTAGQRLYFQSSTTDPDANWYLYNPQLGLVAGANITGDFEVLLPQTGQYLLMVVGTAAEDMSFQIRIITANATTTPLAFDTTITGTLTEAGEEHRFTFTGAPGQRFYYDARDGDFDNINARLLRPDGTPFPGFFLNADSDFGPFTLADAGEYTLILGGNTEVLADYSFRLLSTVPTAGKDTPITGMLDPATEADIFRFSGDTGERLFFNSRTPLAPGAWSLYGPNNVLLASTALSVDFPFVLPQTGPYALVLTTSAADPVSYDFTIVTPDTTTAGGAYGPTLSGTLDEPGERFVFTFVGEYGRRIAYDALDNDFDEITVEFRAPSGTVLFSGNADSDFGPFTQTEEGNYRLIFGGASDALGDFRGALHDLASAASFAGATVSGSLFPGNEIVFYRFAGTAGQGILLENTSASDPDATWRLVGLQNQNLAGPMPIESDLPEVVLPASGDYFVLVEGNPANADTVNFSLRKTVTNPSGSTSGFGLQEGTIDPAEVETFDIIVPAGRWIYFDSLENNADPLVVEISDPDDVVLASLGTTSDFGPFLTTKSGTHKITVKGSDSSSTGDFKFRVYDLATDSLALTAGTSTTATLDEPYETVFYRFDAVAGLRGVYDALSAPGGGSAYATLFTPSGVTLWSCGFGVCDVFTDFGPVTLPDTGTCYLLLASYQADPMAFDFRFIDSSQAPAEAMPVGATKTGTLSPGYELQVYRFPLAGRQRLFGDGRGSDPNAFWSLYGQSNEYLGGASANADFEVDSPLPLEGTGLVLVDGSVADPVPFEIKLSEFSLDNKALSFGTRHTGNLSPGQQHRYTFTGSLGQKGYYDALEADFDNVIARLYSPSGALLAWFNSDSDLGPLTLAETGTYELIIDSNLDATADYAFRLLDLAAAPALTFDTTLSGTLNPPGAGNVYQAVLYRYDTIRNLRLYLDGLGSDTSAAWTLYGANDGVLGGTSVTFDFEATPTLPGPSTLVLSSSTDAAVPYSFKVIPGNHPPELTPVIGNKTLNEETLLTFTAPMVDPELPNDKLTFSLGAGAPTGASIDPNTGVFTWTPTELQGPGVYPVTIIVTDDGVPSMGDSEGITITVNEVNKPPSFTKGAGQTVLEDSGSHTVTNWATDLSTGPPGDAGTTLTFLVSNNNNALFSVQPVISPSGTLTYTSAPDANGSATVTVSLMDNGGTANGGDDTSDPQTFTINVTPVNDAPSFVKGANQTVLEDAGAQTVAGWATAISPGPADEAAQLLTFQVSNDNNGLFSTQPAIAANGTLTYTPAANANGSATVTVSLADNGGADNGGVDTSAAQTFTITVNAVNDVPSFTKGADQTLLEDGSGQTLTGWATAISAGPANESAQTLTFQVSNDNNALFSTQPAIAADGTLTYPPAANANGSASVTVSLKDNGGTDNGGVDTSAAQTFTITVTPVNDAPSFTKGADQTVNEDASAQTFAGWATAISPGPVDEATQVLTFQVSNDNNGLFSTQPAIAANGTLTYTPAANANGSATVTVSLADDGGTDNGGVDTSAAQTFTITVNSVNDVPSFTKGADQTVNEDSGAQTVAGWATAISAGPANESAQTLTFQVSNDNNGLFSAQPAIAANATLTYTPAANANGSATVTVSLKDSGGTDNGGFDTSAVQTFTITVTSVNDVPSFVKGANQTVLEDAGAQTVAGWAAAISPGPADEAAQVLTFQVSNDNNALFSAQPALAANGTLTYTPAANANGSATVTVSLKDSGGTDNGGVDTSAAQTFTITANSVNDVPSFTKGADQTVNEDSGAQTVAGWATAISAGPANESAQTLTFQVSNDNSALFSAQPAVAADGPLTYTPAANANGSATVTVTVKDSGGTANGGVDTSASQAFTINVNSVNDAPSFTKGADQSVNKDVGAQTVAGWATAISAGPADEAGQTLTFEASNNNNALFSAQPAIAANGALSYTPAAGATGTATVTVTLKDSGGTANGGADTSASQTFAITVNEAAQDIVLTPSLVSVNGNFKLVFTGVAGRRHSVQASTDLKSWPTVTTFPAGTGQIEYTDSATSTTPFRFFRVFVEP